MHSKKIMEGRPTLVMHSLHNNICMSYNGGPGIALIDERLVILKEAGFKFLSQNMDNSIASGSSSQSPMDDGAFI